MLGIMLLHVFELSSGSILVKAGDHTFSYTGKPQHFIWERFGFKMHLPENALPSNKECQVSVKASPSIAFQLPNDTELVSAVLVQVIKMPTPSRPTNKASCDR